MYSQIKQATFFLFLVVSLTALSQTKKIYYKNGKLLGEGKMVNEKKEGPWVLYHATGEILGKGSYKNNLEDGYWEAYFPAGEIFFKGNFTNGKRVGKWLEVDGLSKQYLLEKFYDNDKLLNPDKYKAFYQSGEIHAVTGLIDGKKNGIYKAYYKDKTTEVEGKFDKGKRVGPWKEYYENGQLSYSANYVDGSEVGAVMQYHKNGNTESIENYQDDELTGDYLEFFEDGTIKEKTKYVNGKKTGYSLKYLAKNKLLFEGNYVDGEKSGKCVEYKYYKDGTIKSKIEYFGEDYNGEVKYYHTNGKVSSIYNYKNDKKVGSFSSYYDTGKLKKSGTYSYSGKRTGVWKEFFKNGSLESVENYYNGYLSGKAKYYKDTSYSSYLEEEGSYSNDKETGTWFKYYKNGDIDAKITYTNGRVDKEVHATKLYFHNKTSNTVSLAVRFKNLKDEWETAAWYNLKPGKKSYVQDVLDTKVLYFAESKSGVWKGTESRSVNGKYYNMRVFNIKESTMSSSGGKFTMNLTGK
ncbi:toxin-antitoxin system YwqK family antitoxin [Polaribacter aestuariivivens]|uniref:Toxin-antitoxin system YwqK family antitoxin n=1 Tax=Polaribacter aestuariivivens TaxID=2304626 RepID=A0A5S3N7K0_9FLAO|nr:toxin-antitoxin system YwqK family antitoxin [Polaribacter aestuariivivens]TMM31368.1 toxin-antitoxin system YwqK family antitoxin [Polaribacter aestuariivivens]